MGYYDKLDIAGNAIRGFNAVTGIGEAFKKNREKDDYEAAQKAGLSDVDSLLKKQQDDLQQQENAKADQRNKDSVGRTAFEEYRAQDGKETPEKTTTESNPIKNSFATALDTNEKKPGSFSFSAPAETPSVENTIGLRDATQSADSGIPSGNQTGLSSARVIGTQPIDPMLRRIMMHEATAKHLRSMGRIDLADAEIDKAVNAHGQYLSQNKAQREQLAGTFVDAIETGNIQRAIESGKRLTSLVNDGHELTGLTQNKDGTFSVTYGGAGQKPEILTKQQLLNSALMFASNEINEHYKQTIANRQKEAETIKLGAEVPKIASEIRQKDASAHLDNVKAENYLEVYGSKGLTKPQQVKNFEIDKARELTVDLSPEEIKKRTAKFTNTGRENPAFDSLLESRLRIASHRKYGEDEYFDNLRPDVAPSATSPEQRFSADPAMKNYKLGNPTPDGKREVLDASGKLIGHFE